MMQIRGTKGEAVLVYCKSLGTKEMRYPQFSCKVNKMTNIYIYLDCTFSEFQDNYPFLPNPLVLLVYRAPRHLIYATIGLTLRRRNDHSNAITANGRRIRLPIAPGGGVATTNGFNCPAPIRKSCSSTITASMVGTRNL